MENPIKMDDLGVPLFFGNTQTVHCLGSCQPGIVSFASNHGYSRPPKDFLRFGSHVTWENGWRKMSKFTHEIHFHDSWKKSELVQPGKLT